MNNRKAVFVTALSLFGVLFSYQTLSAQDQDNDSLLTIKEAIFTGLENNYSIRIARNQAQISENNVSIGNAGFLPDLDAVGSRSFTRENVTQTFIDGSSNERDGAESKIWNGSLEVNYTIFDGLNTFITYDQLQELSKLGDAEAQVTIENTVNEIMVRYYDIIQQKKVLDVLKSTMEVSEERVNIAQTQLDVGSGSRFQLLQAKTDFNTDKAAVMEQRIVVKNARVELNQLLGRNVTQMFTIDENIPIDRELNFSQLQQGAMAQNVQLQTTRLDQKIADSEIKQIRTEQLPQLDIQFTYDYTDFQSTSGFLSSNKSNGFTYVVTGRMNIFDSFNKRRRIENAKIEQKNAQLAIEDQKNQIRSQLEQAYQDYMNALDLVELETENVDFARQRVDIAVERFRLGSTNSIELRESQRALTDTESRLISAQFRAKQAEIELRRLSGRLINSLGLDQ